MVFNYYYNLTKKQQFIYRKSDQIESVALRKEVNFNTCINDLKEALAQEDKGSITKSGKKIIDGLAVDLGISTVDLKVLSVRPSNHSGELHGLYETSGGKGNAVITLWMRTAKHKRVVAFRTFLRTLLHEFCHHLDYEYFHLADSYHTEGFFKRESSLLKHLLSDEN